MADYPFLESSPDGVIVRLKVVPGASRNQIAGAYGDRLKVQVSAVAEAGKANQAVCELLAKGFGLPRRDVVILEGTSSPFKTFLLSGVTLCRAAEVLAKLLQEAER